jgi:hypothetical protein
MMLASFSCAVTITVLAFYAPHTSRPEAERAEFRAALQRVRHSVNVHQCYIELGDANAKVGTAQAASSNYGGALGPHGTGSQNLAGRQFLDDCMTESLCVANTFFAHKRIHTAACRTFTSPYVPGGDVAWALHSNDVVVVRRKFLSSVRDVRAHRPPPGLGDEFSFSDHRLVLATVRLRLRGIRKRPPPLDFGALARVPEVREQYQQAVAEQLLSAADQLAGSVGAAWEALSGVVHAAADATLPRLLPHTPHQPPPSPLLLQLVRERQTYRASFQPNSRRTRAQKHRLRVQSNAIRSEVRRLRRLQLEEQGETLQAAAAVSDQRQVWRVLRRMAPSSAPTGGSSKRRPAARDAALKDASGQLIVGNVQQAEHLRQHYAAMYNDGVGAAPGAAARLGAPPGPSSPAPAPPLAPEETESVLRRLKNGKAPGPNGVRNEHLKHGGPELASSFHRVLERAWRRGLPDSCKQSDLVSVPKKGDCSLAVNRRGVQVADKLYLCKSKVLADRLGADSEEVLSEAQCGFRAQRGCRDQRFSVQLLVDEALERRQPLYLGFVDLEKAFDRVDREALLAVMRYYGIDEEYIRQTADLHTGTTARVKWCGRRSEPFEICWGVQQGSPASNPMWNLYVNIIVEETLRELGPAAGVEIFWSLDGQLHRPAGTPLTAERLRQLLLLLADDITITCPTASGLQRALDALERAARRWGMRISTKKTQVMVVKHAAAAGSSAPTFSVGGDALAVVQHAKYLGSWFSDDGSLDKEISARLAAAAGAAANLWRSAWRCRRVALRTKLQIYQSAVLTVLLYGAESWGLTAVQAARLETFHQRTLRKILDIKYWQHVTNAEVCARAGLPSIKAVLRTRRLTWLGHVARMDDGRLAKRLMFGQMAGPRPRGAQPVSLRRVYRNDVLALQGGCPNGRSWYQQCQDRTLWQQLVAAIVDPVA